MAGTVAPVSRERTRLMNVYPSMPGIPMSLTMTSKDPASLECSGRAGNGGHLGSRSFEHESNELEGVLFVVHDEHPHACEVHLRARGRLRDRRASQRILVRQVGVEEHCADRKHDLEG